MIFGEKWKCTQMDNINYYIRLAIEKEYDDWEDLGSAPGKEGYRIWKSKSTGEERIQIEKPGTPSTKTVTNGLVLPLAQARMQQDEGRQPKPPQAQGPSSSAPWLVLSDDEIMAVLDATPVIRKEKEAESLNMVVFDFDRDNNGTVFKPKKYEVAHNDPRYRQSQSDMEVLAYAFDRILGFDIVPPTKTVSREIEIPSVLGVFGKPRKEMNEGSAQLMVAGKNGWAVGYDNLTSIFKNSQSVRSDMEKITIFDFLTSNSDRNPGNYIVSDDGCHAVDNGISFSYLDSRHTGDKTIPDSNIYKIVTTVGGGVDERTIAKVVEKVRQNKDRINAEFDKRGMDHEKQHFWDRVKNVHKLNSLLEDEYEYELMKYGARTPEEKAWLKELQDRKKSEQF